MKNMICLDCVVFVVLILGDLRDLRDLKIERLFEGQIFTHKRYLKSSKKSSISYTIDKFL